MGRTLGERNREHVAKTVSQLSSEQEETTSTVIKHVKRRVEGGGPSPLGEECTMSEDKNKSKGRLEGFREGPFPDISRSLEPDGLEERAAGRKKGIVPIVGGNEQELRGRRRGTRW